MRQLLRDQRLSESLTEVTTVGNTCFLVVEGFNAQEAGGLSLVVNSRREKGPAP